MHTIEATHIMPVIFIITCLFITLAFRTHDAVVSKSAQYGILIDQSVSCENKLYSPRSGYTKKEIADIISELYITRGKSRFSACLSGSSLYLIDNAADRPIQIFFSHYEKCDTIRKETALIPKQQK